MEEKVIRTVDIPVTRVSGVKLQGKPYFTVERSFLLGKNKKLPKTVILLDAPEEGNYLEFGNCENDTYYSRNYEWCLAVVDID